MTDQPIAQIPTRESVHPAAPPVAPTADLPSATTVGPGQLRPGDNDYGRPSFPTKGAKPLSEKKRDRHREVQTQQINSRLQPKAAPVDEQGDGNGVIVTGIARFMGFYGFLLAAIPLGLLLVGQVTTAIATVSSLPLAGQWIVWGLLALLGSLALFLIFQCIAAAFRLRTNRPFDLKLHRELTARGEMQKDGAQNAEAAKQELLKYLANYPTEDRFGLLAAGFTDDEVRTLARQRDALQGAAETTPSAVWIEDFLHRFQQILDTAAQRRVKRDMKSVGLKAALCPLPLADTAIVLISHLHLLRDLMFIYNLKTSAGSAGMMLLRTLTHAYLGGEAQAFSSAAMDHVGEIAAIGLGQVGAQAIKLGGSKVAEIAIHAFFSQRIGSSAIRLLQPVRTR